MKTLQSLANLLKGLRDFTTFKGLADTLSWLANALGFWQTHWGRAAVVDALEPSNKDSCVRDRAAYFGLFFSGLIVVPLWFPLWVVHQWLSLVFALPCGLRDLLALTVQLLMMDKAQELFYVVSLVVFHYGDEVTDLISIFGWWGCNLYTAECNEEEQERGFAIAGTVA